MTTEPKRVVTVGGASVERVLVVDPERYRSGGKHTLAPSPTLAGGSAVNTACRLLATGVETLPIAPVCEDVGGHVVLRTLVEAARHGGCHPPTGDELFLPGCAIGTPHTTITSVGGERTVFTEFSPTLFEPFARHLERSLKALRSSTVGALMVGHLHADRPEPPGCSGRLTEQIVHTAQALGVPVFANFGSAQYRQGMARWADLLPHLSCFQLDIAEVRSFLAEDGHEPTLQSVLERFRDVCTVVITLERLGAVARRKGSDHVVLAWPYAVDVVDTTGAGDALGAGLVSSLLEAPWDDDEALVAAMDRGALFAAHACTTRGGADHCPTLADLEAFRARNRRVLEIELASLDDAEGLLTLLDRAFPDRL